MLSIKKQTYISKYNFGFYFVQPLFMSTTFLTEIDHPNVQQNHSFQKTPQGLKIDCLRFVYARFYHNDWNDFFRCIFLRVVCLPSRACNNSRNYIFTLITTFRCGYFFFRTRSQNSTNFCERFIPKCARCSFALAHMTIYSDDRKLLYIASAYTYISD